MNHVSIAPGTSTQNGDRIYHQPHPEKGTVPKCRNNRRNGTRWVKKDPDTLPHHRECRQCAGDNIEKSHTGPQLCSEIEGLWADDSEGSA